MFAFEMKGFENSKRARMIGYTVINGRLLILTRLSGPSSYPATAPLLAVLKASLVAAESMAAWKEKTWLHFTL